MNIAITNQRLAQVLSVVILVTISICSLAVWKTRLSMESSRLAKADYSAARAKLFQRLDNTDFLRTNMADFSRYKRDGKIGSPDPLKWVDALETIGSDMNLSEFHYEMSPSKAVEIPRLQHAELQVVTISLRIDFLHDGEIFNYFTALSDRISAAYEITEFDVVRVSGIDTATETENEQADGSRFSTLKVVCRINWYAVILPSETSPVDV